MIGVLTFHLIDSQYVFFIFCYRNCDVLSTFKWAMTDLSTEGRKGRR